MFDEATRAWIVEKETTALVGEKGTVFQFLLYHELLHQNTLF